MFRILQTVSIRRRAWGVCAGVVAASWCVAAGAEPAPALNSGDTAWMLTSMALVLFMTIPGLALFYGGLVRTKNVLSAPIFASQDRP